jgi:hypothetical protein
MANREWELNSNWRELDDSVTNGDIVHLKLCDVFRYLVKVIVTHADKHEIVGIIDGVFDWESKAYITQAEVLSLLGRSMTFHKNMIHFVRKQI